MTQDHWFKITAGAIAFLLSLALWFAQTELSDQKAQNKSLWQNQAKMNERIAKIEGWHEAERCYTTIEPKGK